MWWRLDGFAVLTAPQSLAAGDSSMSPLCLLYLPVPPAWVLILTESVLTPKREKDGAIKCGAGRRESSMGSAVDYLWLRSVRVQQSCLWAKCQGLDPGVRECLHHWSGEQIWGVMAVQGLWVIEQGLGANS